jgi:enolase-phosphatase E1
MIRAVLCDIEGTTTSLSFVHDVLFPLSREKMHSFIQDNWASSEFQTILDELKKQIPGNASASAVADLLQTWIDADKKETTLKQIQGRIWKDAFESGKIKAHIYPDVPEKWAEWKRQGLKIYIFSSGSVEAQQLLFRYSEAGDLTQYIDGYFDTTTGPKKVAASYLEIANVVKIDPAGMLFLSDILAELDAAKEAGMQTIQLIRNSGHRIATTFQDIRL